VVITIGMREQMRQICNLPALKYIPHYTYDDYSHWEGKWELIDGIPVAMSPAPVLKHQRIAGNLFYIFKHVLKAKCQKCLAYQGIDWLVKDDTVLQPDFLIACDSSAKKYLDQPPVLVAEILSPSTAIKDRNAKFQIYESQKVRYYLILDVNTEKIEIYELIKDRYEPVAVNPAALEFNLHHNCLILIPFHELWD
jgi:Uma2 family endonuclease